MSDLKQIADRLLSLEQRVMQLEMRNSEVEPSPKNGKKISIKEFIIGKRPSNDVEKTLAIGYFLEHFTGASSFNIDDLGRNFQLAKEPIPTNINDKVNLNIRKGHMTEVKEKKDKKKAWTLTNSGEQFVENGFKEKAQ